MTAILGEIRQLEAAARRGDISDAELEAAKARLMDTVEDAATDVPPPEPEAAPPIPDPAIPDPEPESAAPPRALDFRAFDVVTFCIIAGFLCVVVGTVLFGDLTIALTLTITLLAAFAVRAFVMLDD